MIFSSVLSSSPKALFKSLERRGREGMQGEGGEGEGRVMKDISSPCLELKI